MNKIYFPIGISGSGKSTYIDKHFKPEVIVSPDDLRRKLTGDVTDHSQEGKVWATVPVLLKQKLEKYGMAILDATNVNSGDRAGLLKKFNRDEVERIAIVFEADPEESKRRIHKDIEDGKDRSDVPDDVIDKQQVTFKRGFKSIKQQFDKIIYADRKGDNSMSKVKKEDIQKIKKMVSEELKSLKEEDAKEEMEKVSYQSYQDMYLTPQSNWRVKKYAEMYDADGNLHRGNLGEVHRIQTVEYDFMHTGEVVTECGGKTYNMNAEDFRECFEMVHDEEGLNVSNESVTVEDDIRKLIAIKDYFGKNIKSSIERLEERFLAETEKNKNSETVISFAEKYDMKYDTDINRYTHKEDVYFYGTVADFFSDKIKSNFNQVTDPDDFDKNLRPDHVFGIEVFIPYLETGQSTKVQYYIIPYEKTHPFD